MKRLLALLLAAALGATAAPPAVPGRPFRAVLLSDFNGPYGSTTYPAPLARVMRRILTEWKPDLVLSAGDLVAGQSRRLGRAQLDAMWAGFGRAVRTPLAGAGIPFAFTLGNHDAAPGFPLDRAAAGAYWSAHPPGLNYVDKADYPFRYSFVFRGAFFVVLDASGPRQPDRAWLARELARPEARGAGARMVMGHLPLYGLSVGRSDAGNVLAGAEGLRAVMEAGRVTAYLSGHHAAFYPGRRGQLNLLASGGIGGRDYVGHPGTARSTVTLLAFGPGGIRLQTFDADTGAEIDTNALPPFLDGYGGRVQRVNELR